MQAPLVLYHYWRSSCSWRVRWVLALKNISYQSVPINLLENEQLSPAFLAKNPAGLVPCLDVSGRVLGESLAIIEWLEETYPQNPILPRNPWDRARARELALIVAAGIQPLQNLRVIKRHSDDQEERQRWIRAFIESGLQLIESKLAADPDRGLRYCLGDSLSLADIFLVPQVYNAHRFGVNMEALPSCEAIYRHCLTEPLCDAASPPRQPEAASDPHSAAPKK